MSQVDINEINKLKSTISGATKYSTSEYKKQCRSLSERMRSVISQYSEYGDVTSKARDIISLLNELESDSNKIERLSEKITKGLSEVVKSVNEEEQESKQVIRDEKVQLDKVKFNSNTTGGKGIGIAPLAMKAVGDLAKANNEQEINVENKKILGDQPIVLGKATNEQGKTLDADKLKEELDRYVHFTYTDAQGNKVQIQLPYDWAGKKSVDDINELIRNKGYTADTPGLQGKVTKLADASEDGDKYGIDCSGLVLRTINSATNGLAVEYYKQQIPEFKGFSEEGVLSWGITARNLTSEEYSTKVTKLAEVQPGDYIRFDNGDHIGIVTAVDGNVIHYTHSSGDKGPHNGTITVTGDSVTALNAKGNATFNDWDSQYSQTIQGLYNYICRPNFLVGKEIESGAPEQVQTVPPVTETVPQKPPVIENQPISNEEIEKESLWDTVVSKVKDSMDYVSENFKSILKGFAVVGVVLLNPSGAAFMAFAKAINAFLNKNKDSHIDPTRDKTDLSYLEGGILYEKIDGKIYKNGQLVSPEQYKYIPAEIGGERKGKGHGLFAQAYVEGSSTYEKIGDVIYKNGKVIEAKDYKYIPKEIGGLRDTKGEGHFVAPTQTYVEGDSMYQRIGGLVYKNGKRIEAKNYEHVPKEIGGLRDNPGQGVYAQGYKEGDHTYIKLGEDVFKDGRKIDKGDYKHIPKEIGGLREAAGQGIFIMGELGAMLKGGTQEVEQLEGNALADYWRDEVVDFAKQFEGKITYLYGSNEPQVIDPKNPPKYMDCSDFVGSVYKTLFGIDLGGYTGAQREKGIKVSYDELKPGDLIFFDTEGANNGDIKHVGIYIGNGKFIDEGGGDYTGNVRTQDLNKYWKGAVVSCRRIIQDDGNILNTQKVPLPSVKSEIKNTPIVQPNEKIEVPKKENNLVNKGTVSSKGLDFILKTEGFHAEAYRGVDNKNLTIGYGHVIRPGEKFGTLTEAQARELFMEDLYQKGYVQAVIDIEKKLGKKFSQNEFDALVSFSFNLGPYWFSKYEESDFVKLLKEGNYTEQQFIDAITIFHHSQGEDVKGLYNRRYDEAEVFLYGEYERLYKRTITN